jgi:putative oxidoreductase
MNLLSYLFNPAMPQTVDLAYAILRIGIGLLTIPHGYPKLMGGVSGWQNLGTIFMSPLGITFLPVMWGFLGAAAEFFGGIALTLGFGTRIASFALILMMIIAAAWHVMRGDEFNVYSFPLSLIVVFIYTLIMGDGKYSLVDYLSRR